MLTKNQKKKIVERITQRVSDSKTVVLCDFKGLDVARIRQLRGMLREKQAQLEVAKKTLIAIALKNSGSDLDARNLEGQMAIITGGEDEIAAPKVLADFTKENKDFRILAGLLESNEVSDEDIKNLAKLPTRQQLLGQVAGTINAPISGFVNVLAGNIRGLVTVLNGIKDIKS